MNSVIPIYYQIKHTIRNWIINKEFGLGERIPSENELAEKFKVTRLTVRQALSQLVQEGFLISKRGEGTFVTHNPELINSFSLEFTGFMDDLFYQISKSKTKSVAISRKVAPKPIKEKLQLIGDEVQVEEIKRVRFLENQPFAYTTNYLPLEIGMKINGKDLYRKSLLQILEQDLGIRFTEAFQTIHASFANQEVADRLKIASGTPILFVERIMYGARHKPVELVQSSYRGDLYKYIVRFKNVKRRNGNIWIHRSR